MCVCVLVRSCGSALCVSANAPWRIWDFRKIGLATSLSGARYRPEWLLNPNWIRVRCDAAASERRTANGERQGNCAATATNSDANSSSSTGSASEAATTNESWSRGGNETSVRRRSTAGGSRWQSKCERVRERKSERASDRQREGVQNNKTWDGGTMGRWDDVRRETESARRERMEI